MENNINATIKMSNGVEIPALGLGVWKATDEAQLGAAIKTALDAGYRHIDTASVYENEGMVGSAVAKYANRKELFITTKIWNGDHERAEVAFEESLRLLQTDYVDLYLIHWPSPMVGNFHKAWKSFIKIYETGKARAIGVSNFKQHHIEEIIQATGFVPHMNQVERHPFYQQNDVAEYCKSKNIALTAYSPLGSGRLEQLAPSIKPIAEKHSKTEAQVILRWQFQTGWSLIPKSVNPSRIIENAALFDFELDKDDMDVIAKLDSGTKFLSDPDTATF